MYSSHGYDRYSTKPRDLINTSCCQCGPHKQRCRHKVHISISHRTQSSELIEFGIKSISLRIFQSLLIFEGRFSLTQIPMNLSLRNIAHDNYVVAWATLCNDIVTRVRILVMAALRLISITMARSWVKWAPGLNDERYYLIEVGWSI